MLVELLEFINSKKLKIIFFLTQNWCSKFHEYVSFVKLSCQLLDDKEQKEAQREARARAQKAAGRVRA